LRRPRQELLVRAAAVAALCDRDPVELALDVLESPGLRLEPRQEGTKLGRGLPQQDTGVAELGAGLRELGGDPLERRDRSLSLRGEPGGAVSLVGCERLRGGGGALGELGQVPEPLSLREQLGFGVLLEAPSVLHERVELGEARLGLGRVPCDLVEAPPGCGELAPSLAERGTAPQLLVPCE
jgi:hypothetical protein